MEDEAKKNKFRSGDAKNNPFHRIQSSMQAMSRGRAKGNVFSSSDDGGVYTPSFLRKKTKFKGGMGKKKHSQQR